MNNIFRNLYIILFLLFIVGCSKNTDTIQSSELGDLSIEFDHIVGGQKLILSNTTYRNALQENYTVDVLRYYISNIVLQNVNGDSYTIPVDSSYFLIDASIPTNRFAKMKVPSGDYHQIQFVVGVDSLRNTKELSERTGVLDPQENMYWGWNSGYIFFKMEGVSSSVPTNVSADQRFRFHIGGFGGYSSPTINNIKIVQLSLSERGLAQVRANRRSNIHLMVDIGKVMNGTEDVSLQSNSQVMFSAFSTIIASNYASMFVHDHTEN